ncbi:MAG: hypothetical protein ABIH71_00435 [Candidatus Omnitrophota bacterium]
MISYFLRFWQKWGKKAGFSVMDQGIFSGANFFLNIFLIRSLIPSEYGIFAISFSIFLFISGFHQALVLEPISVIGASHHKDKLGTYLGATMWIHGYLTLIFASIILLIAIIMRLNECVFSGAFFGLSIATPLILFFWLFQRICYLKLRPDLSLKGSLLYAFLLFSGIIVSNAKSWISPFNALFIMGFASGGVIVVFWNFMSVKAIDLSWNKIKFVIRDVLRDNWRYGKWVIGSAFTNWISLLIYVPLIGIFAGTDKAGVFKAMQDLFLPLQKVLIALSFLFLPWVSKQFVIQGKNYLKKNIYKFIAVSVLLSGIYVIAIISFKGIIVKFLYGSGYYTSFLWLLPWLGIAVIIRSMNYGVIMGLKALKCSNAVFFGQAAAVVVTLTLGLYLVKNLKLYGAAVSSFLAIFVIIIVGLYFLEKRLKHI